MRRFLLSHNGFRVFEREQTNDLSREWGTSSLVDVVLRIKKEGDPDEPIGATFRSSQTLSLEDVADFARTDRVGTPTDSRAYSEGVEYVLGNGEFVLDDGEPTYRLASETIRNQAIW